jgi:apolipoprotein N-acyltransferase
MDPAWLAAAATGFLLALACAPLGAWPLAWVALVPLWTAVRRAPDARRAADLAGVSGLIFYGVSLHWLVKVFGAAAAAFWCVFALFLCLHAVVLRRWSARGMGDAVWVIGAAVLWVGLEYFRSETWRLDCSWLALGYTQTSSLPMLQTCSVVGLYGLSGLIVAFNAAVVLLIEKKRSPALAAMALAGALYAWGTCRIRVMSVDAGRPLNVAIVQDESYDLRRLASLSLSPAAKNADLLIWPEYALTVPAGMDDRYRGFVADSLRGSKSVAVIGAATFPEDMKRGREWNFAWVLAPGGRLLGRYDKLHPIPYVERLLRPNPAPRAVDTPLGRLAVQICYDLDFEDGVRRLAREGAELIVVPDLDPLEWGRWQHRQHSAMSAARAVESGLWVARAASSGESQLIDPTGRIVAAAATGESRVLSGAARLGRSSTFYERIGWLTGPLALALVILALAAEGYGLFVTRVAPAPVPDPGS